jgi:hypothetical protein
VLYDQQTSEAVRPHIGKPAKAEAPQQFHSTVHAAETASEEVERSGFHDPPVPGTQPGPVGES